jgi:hypothetical protein
VISKLHGKSTHRKYRSRMHTLFYVLMFAAVVSGCGTPAEVPPGTQGVVRAAGIPLADVEVQIYPHSIADEPLGSGITDANGRFQLRLPGLTGPLHLKPGDYRITIASAGEIHLSWPAEFSDPQRSPLGVTITARQPAIELDVPLPKVRY